MGILYSFCCRDAQRPQKWDLRFKDITAEPIVNYNRTAQASHFVELNLSSENMMWTLELPDRRGNLSQRTVYYRMQDARSSLSSILYLQTPFTALRLWIEHWLSTCNIYAIDLSCGVDSCSKTPLPKPTWRGKGLPVLHIRAWTQGATWRQELMLRPWRNTLTGLFQKLI